MKFLRSLFITLFVVLAVFILWVFGDDPTLDSSTPDATEISQSDSTFDACENADDCTVFDEDDLEWSESPDDCYPDEIFDYDLNMCIVDEDQDTDDILDDVPEEDFDTEPGEDAVDTFIEFTVVGDELRDPEEFEVADQGLVDMQADTQLQQETWRYFATLIPAEYRSSIAYFGFFSDGEQETLAWATPLEDDPDQWLVAIDMADTTDVPELTATIIHEFAHVLTLNTNQGTYESAESCDIYLSQDWCANEDSYLQAFTSEFWGDIQTDWDDIQQLEDPDELSDALVEFYEEREDEFVSEYAATHPDEDIAESFSEFMLTSKPTGNSIKEQKVRFFYDYPELVEMRDIIAPRAASRLRR